MAAEVFVEEFLYRGQPSADAADAAWHVVLGAADVDAFGKPVLNLNGPLNMTQAIAAGWPLPTILAAINSASLTQIEAVQAQLAAAQTQSTTLEQELTDAQTQLVAAASQIAELKAQLVPSA